jgi:hypothetical protein
VCQELQPDDWCFVLIVLLHYYVFSLQNLGHITLIRMRTVAVFCSCVSAIDLLSSFPTCVDMLRGGHHQKRRAEAAQAGSSTDAPIDPAVLGTSAMETVCIKKWMWGKFHATDVQSVAHAAVLDGATHPNVLSLSQLGASGSSPQHVHTQLLGKYAKTIGMPCLDFIPCPVVDPRDQEAVVQYSVPTILFHKWVMHLAKNYRADYNRIFGIERRRAFWDAVSECGP